MPTHDITPRKIGIMTEDGFREFNAPSIEAITLEAEAPETTELVDTIMHSGERQLEMSFKTDKNQMAEFIKELQPKHGDKLILEYSCICDGTLMHAIELIRKLRKKGCTNISVRSENIQNKECPWMTTKFTATGIFWNTNNWHRMHGVPMVMRSLTMCEYCEKLERQGMVNLIITDANISKLGTINTNLEISTDGEEYFLGTYSNFDNSDDSFGGCMKISFCPICGRKLGDD